MPKEVVVPALSLLLLLVQGEPPGVLADEHRVLPTLGVTVREQRWLDPDSRRIRRRTTDARTGAPIDADALLRREASTRDVQNGKMWHALRSQLPVAAALDVVFWLHRPAGHPDLRATLDRAIDAGQAAADARRTALDEAQRLAATVTGPFAAALGRAGFAVRYVDPFVPFVCATMASDQVPGWAARAEVDQAYYCFPTAAPEVCPAPINEWASPTARTDFVHLKGIRGQGVRVLVNDVGNVTTANPYLPPVTRGNNAADDSHAAAVSGIVCSKHPQQTGAAPGIDRLFVQPGYDDVATPAAWAFGMQNGISFGNCSWWNGNRGSIVFLDRYFDYIIRNFGVMMFKSCGNQGNNQPTTTPGNGFNTTATGNADERNTHDWDDDRMNTGSSTRNPQPSNHEKPELAAHGTGISTTTNRSPWITSNAGSGTSFASPVVCGTAALLASTDNALLAKPEVVKAMLMAGAWNNIHGGKPLSDFDGAGGVDAAAAQSAVEDGQYHSATLTPSSFTAGVYRHTLYLDRHDTARVVALWFSQADSSYSTDVLEMDLDMTIEDPAGNVVAASASPFNPFEIAMFRPPVSGTYTVVLHVHRFDGDQEPLAIAWTTAMDTATDLVSFRGPASLGATVGVEFSDRYHPRAPFFALLSTVGYPETVRVAPGRVLPMGVDVLTAAVLAGQLPGFQGVLDGNGEAQTVLPIPNDPGLSGLQLYAAMCTLETTSPEVEETSPVAMLEIR